MTAAFTSTMAQFIAAAVPAKMRAKPDLRRLFRVPHAETPPKDIDLVVLAVDRLGPASLRAAAVGKPVEVVVPDERIATVFRAALEETRLRRPTDRLISLVVRGAAP
jgi:hypothetical protein